MILLENFFLALLGSLLFLVYTPSYHSELPDIIRYIFSFNIMIFVMFLLLIYFRNSNLTLSIILAISIALIKSLINKHDLKYHFIDKINKDFYEIEKNNKLETFKNDDKYCIDLKPYKNTFKKIGGSLKKCMKKIFGNSIGGLCDNREKFEDFMNENNNFNETRNLDENNNFSNNIMNEESETEQEEEKGEQETKTEEEQETKTEEEQETKIETEEEKSLTLSELIKDSNNNINYNDNNMNY